MFPNFDADVDDAVTTAECRSIANLVRKLVDAFVAEGFSKTEAMSLAFETMRVVRNNNDDAGV